MATKFGFQDLRTTAELALAPGQPLGRTITKPSGLKAGVGVGDVPLIGRITDAASMGSASFAQFKSRLQQKQAMKTLASSITDAVKGFDAQSSALINQTTSIRDTSVFGMTSESSVTSGGFFSASDLVQFSSMRPGANLSDVGSFRTQLAQRKAQLSSIAARLSSASGTFSLFGAGVIENYNRQPYPTDQDIDAPSTPKLAIGGAAGASEQALKDKFKFVVKGAQTARPKPTFWTRLTASLSDPLKNFKKMPGYNSTLNMTFQDDKANQSGWSEPAPPYASQWPYNKVTHTESGHLFELDDTPGAERVHIFHRSGSFVEFHPDGKVVYKSMGHGYLISMSDQYVKVSGTCSISVDGDACIYARGQINLQSDKDVNINTKSDFNVFAKNINLRAKKKAVLDGTSIDLRFVKLPGRPVFTSNGLAPRLIPAAIALDFPELADTLSTLTDGVTPPLLTPDVVTGLPVDNPLGNPLIYHATTTDAVSYRERLMDTPEEISDFETYQAHIDTRVALQDLASSAPQIPGKRESLSLNTPVATSLPEIDYLDRDSFRNSIVDPTATLGGTSFTVTQLVDSLAQPDVANHLADALNTES